MIGLYSFMLDQSRKDSDYCMETGFTTYLKPNIKKRPAPVIVRTYTVVVNNQSSILLNDEANVSSDSVSLDETMSSCNSMKSTVGCADNGDSQAIASMERRSKENLLISEGVIETKGWVYRPGLNKLFWYHIVHVSRSCRLNKRKRKGLISMADNSSKEEEEGSELLG